MYVLYFELILHVSIWKMSNFAIFFFLNQDTGCIYFLISILQDNVFHCGFTEFA